MPISVGLVSIQHLRSGFLEGGHSLYLEGQDLKICLGGSHISISVVQDTEPASSSHLKWLSSASSRLHGSALTRIPFFSKNKYQSLIVPKLCKRFAWQRKLCERFAQTAPFNQCHKALGDASNTKGII